MEWRYPWPTDDDLCMRVCVWWCCWCGVLFENSRVCFVQYVLDTTVCCVVMMCIGETGCCDSALVPPFFWWGVGVRGWYRICFLILLRSCFWCGLVVLKILLWCLLVGTFVWGAEHGVRWCAWCCVSLFFVLSVVHCFFESYGIMRLLFVFVTESLILAQDERWRRA